MVHESTIAEASAPGDTARIRLTIESAQTGHLSQRVTRYARGTSAAREVDADAEEVLFVTDGQGTLILGVERHALEPEVGVYLAPGETYAIEQLGGGELTVVSVLAPLPDDVAEPVGDRRVTVRVADQPALPAGKDREFRFVITPDVGCRGFTQFVGWVPPGRARDHYHLYDEVVYILEGTGVLHRKGEEDVTISSGSCIHFAPRMVHCVENVGTEPLRVMGVFRPAGSAAEAYHPDEDEQQDKEESK